MPPADDQPPFLASQYHSTMPPEAYANLVESTGDARRPPGWLVVLGQQPLLPHETYLKAFADAMALDMYSARQRLMTPSPRILRRELKREEAERWVVWLREIGLKAFAFSDAELETFDPWCAVSFILDNDKLVLRFSDDSHQEAPFSDILCLVTGKVTESQHRQIESRDLFGGVVYSRNELVGQQSSFFIDIHMASIHRVYRLSDQWFRFNEVFGDYDAPNVFKMQKLGELIASHCPAAQQYSLFDRVSESLAQSWQILSRAKNCEFRAAGRTISHFGLETHTLVEKNELVAFNLYSYLSRMQLQRA